MGILPVVVVVLSRRLRYFGRLLQSGHQALLALLRYADVEQEPEPWLAQLRRDLAWCRTLMGSESAIPSCDSEIPQFALDSLKKVDGRRRGH